MLKSKKLSRKNSKKLSRKNSKKLSRKNSKKLSRKNSKKLSRKCVGGNIIEPSILSPLIKLPKFISLYYSTPVNGNIYAYILNVLLKKHNMPYRLIYVDASLIDPLDKNHTFSYFHIRATDMIGMLPDAVKQHCINAQELKYNLIFIFGVTMTANVGHIYPIVLYPATGVLLHITYDAAYSKRLNTELQSIINNETFTIKDIHNCDIQMHQINKLLTELPKYFPHAANAITLREDTEISNKKIVALCFLYSIYPLYVDLLIEKYNLDPSSEIVEKYLESIYTYVIWGHCSIVNTMVTLFLLNNDINAEEICEYLKELPSITYYRYIILFINHIDDIIIDIITNKRYSQDTLYINDNYEQLISLYPELDAIAININDTEPYHATIKPENLE